MLRDPGLTQARSAQASVMTETVYAATLGDPVVDRATGETLVPENGVYEGPARVVIVASAAPAVTAAGETVTPTTVAVTVPWDTTLPIGARVRVLASRNTGHPLVGADVWIETDTTGAGLTAHRYTGRAEP